MPENEYDDLIAEGEVKELPVLNEYDRAIDQMADDNRTRVKTAAFSGSVVNPDERARSMDLASKNNLPVDVVERNPEHVRRMDVLRRNDYDDIIDRSPKFAEWLSDPNHAALSQDDIESLRGISELVSGKDYYGPPRSQHDYIAIARDEAIRKGSLTDYIRTLPIIRNVAGLVGGVGQGVKDIAGAAAFVAEIAGADGALEAQKSLASESADIGRDIAGMGSSSLERGAQRVVSGVARVATGVVAAGTAVRGLQFIGMAPRMAGYLGQGTFAAALGAEQANLQANESEVSGGAKAAYIMEHAATEAGFTLLFGLRGAEAFGQPLTPIITDTFKRYLHYAGEAAGEIIEENATNLAHDFIDYMQLPENANQTVGDAFNNWLASVPETTAISGIVGGFAPSLRHSRAQIQDAKRAEATFTALGTGVKDSKTYQRLPEAVKKLIEGQTKNGPMANLYLPIDTWNTYWQSQGADPREVAAQVTGDPNAYDQAVLAGHDLTVPTARYATTIAPSDHNGFFVKELRTSPAAMNSREADTLSKELEKAQPEAAKESAANVAGIIEEQLINAGYDPSAAKTNASLHEAFYGTMAAKAGIDPQVLFDRYHQRTTRAVPESVKANVEPIDAMLDRLRSNDIPNDKEIFGKTLIEFLRPSGLRDSQGDLASLEPNASTKAFQRHLMREDGIDLDEASQRAHRAGYIKEPDINLLLDAIGEELAGRPTYMEGQEHPTKLAIRQGLDELSSYLREIGVDVQKQSNAEIKKIMEGHGLNEEVSAEAAQELNQPAYHGSPYQFDKFSLEHMGKGEGNQSYGWGLYFAGKKEVARYYRDVLAGTDAVYFLDGKETSRGKVVLSLKGGAAEIEQNHSRTQAAVRMVADNGGVDAALKVIDEWENQEIGSEKYRSDMRTAIEDLRGHDVERKDVPRGGRVYKVDIPDDDMFLLWDKPLSEQPNGVLNALRKIKSPMIAEMLQPIEMGNTYGSAAYHALKAELFTAKDASQALHGVGIPGIKYLDANSRTSGDGSFNYVLFDDSAIKILEYEQSGDTKKIGGYNRLSHQITLYEGANRSTFLHESGHFFLEVFGDLAQDANAPQQLKDDYQKALDWLGVKSRDEIGRDQHEQWARGFEHYLAEGKAPSNALRRAFASFRQWLVGIYKNLLNLNVTLTDEVRGVMDRLLAVDNEILAAEERLGFAPVFTTAKDAGWTDAEFANYRAAVTSAQTNATEKLTMQVMEQMDREKRAWWDRELKAAREEVTRDIDQRPLARALALLQRGTLPDGSPLPEGVKAVKLDKKAIVEEFGHDFLKKLPRPYIYTTKDGVHPQTMAEQFGFKTASYFLHALANAPRRKDQIKTEADALMLQKYPDMRLDGSMPEAAVKAVHNEKRSDLLELEVAKLSEKSKGRAAPADFLRSKARSVIAGMTGRNVQPLVYQRAEAKANHAAFKAASKGDFATALQEKQRELYNHELYRAAVDARADMEKIAAYMRGFRKEAVRSRLGKAGADYLEQIDAINARFEFAMVPGWKAGVQRSFTEWVTAKQASGESFGEEIGAPPELTNEGFKANYKDLTIETLRGIRDTVKQIATMARESNRMLAMDKAAKWSQVKADLIASLKENYAGRGKPPFTPDGLSGFDKLKAGAAKFDASLIKMEQLIEWLDGGKIDGPWHKALWNGASDAQNAENDYTKTVTAPIAEAVNSVPKAIRKHMLDKIDIPGIERAMVRKNIIAVALNVGNASNRAKLLKGMQWNEAQLQSMLKVLTKEEWDVVQGIWDTLESIYPNIAALQKELTGLEPEKVVATPVTTEHGTYRGGYYPVMYDQSSNVGEMQLASDIGGLVEKHFTRATTPKGHTKKRAEAFAKPFDLSLERLPNHIAGVVKDLTYRKWLIDANKIVNDEEIRAVLVERLGEPYAKLFPAWVRQVVNDRNVASAPSLASWRGLMEHARYNLTIMGIGFKVGTMTSQLAGIAPAIETVGGNELDGHKYMTAALGKFLASPKSSYQFITAKSGEMRHRFENRELSIRDKIRTLQGNDSLLSKIQQTAFLGVGYSEMMVSAPTWLAGYQKALDQGHSDADAVRNGDRAVRLSQGAAGAKDLSAVVADRETMRLFTLFYTPWSALYSRLRSIGHDAGNVRNLPRTIIRAGWTTIVAATLGEILSGHGPKEDEPWWKWWIRVNAIYPFMGIPVVRDIAAATVSDYGYQFSPLAQAGKAVAAVGKDTIDVFQGDAEIDKLAIDSLNAAGYALGLPVGQLKITGDYLLDLASGDDSPEDIGQFMHDLFYRRDKK